MKKFVNIRVLISYYCTFPHLQDFPELLPYPLFLYPNHLEIKNNFLLQTLCQEQLILECLYLLQTVDVSLERRKTFTCLNYLVFMFFVLLLSTFFYFIKNYLKHSFYQENFNNSTLQYFILSVRPVVLANILVISFLGKILLLQLAM